MAARCGPLWCYGTLPIECTRNQECIISANRMKTFQVQRQNNGTSHSNSFRDLFSLSTSYLGLYSTYVHGNRFNLHNKISVRDTIQMRHDESLQERMVRWREFFWSYRDYNDSVLLQAHKAKSFEKFAALSQLPAHNQQVRMMAAKPLTDWGINP